MTECVAEVIDATREQCDDNSQRSKLDVTLTRAGGTQAALEISPAAHKNTFSLGAYCSKPRRLLAGAYRPRSTGTPYDHEKTWLWWEAKWISSGTAPSTVK